MKPRIRALALATGLAGLLMVAVPGSLDGAGATGVGRPIRPGVQMVAQGAQCTANFVFHQVGHPHRKLIGMAAHCVGRGNDNDTNGCTTPSYPLGTAVQFVTGANLVSGGTLVGRGRLVYSSWIAMHKAHTSSSGACGYNDLALVAVGPRYRSRVSPTVPQLGGPRSLQPLPPVGSTIYTLGSSSLRGTTQAKSGTVQSRSAWTMTVRTASPGVPGDSGSGFLGPHGAAVGVLSTIDLFPDTGANGVGSLLQEVRFARHHGMPGLRLTRGGAFTPAG